MFFPGMSKMASEMENEMVAEDKLVEKWADFPCLFDVSSVDFKNRDKRLQAYEQLAESVEQNVEWVKNKLRLLRNSYTKAKKPLSSGSARKPLSKRSQWLVDKLQFLAPFCVTRATVSNLDFSPPSTPVVDIETGNMDTGDSFSQENEQKSTKEPTKVRGKSIKRKREEEEYELLRGIACSLAEKNKTPPCPPECDEIDNFGKYIVSSLRKLDPTICLMAQNKIQNVLFEAQVGAFGYNLNPTLDIPSGSQGFPPNHPRGMASTSQHMVMPHMHSYRAPFPHFQRCTGQDKENLNEDTTCFFNLLVQIYFLVNKVIHL